ncbi:hypothetical protein [Corallococcus llansteffanensis]|uniref:Lipoprotein n=1 Tax=Corallococcus llansteffanensis TaxID=2316731 RepID=A0A3A8QML3_9BACT|nr:hypothetical protein [Corallococcus llansteffanensis]RKH67595.1 hypothetical protein D7V93_02670 [Corallococcus llansteffanensis]
MNKFARSVCLGSALVVSACGGSEQVEGEELAQQSARLLTASSQGCDYSVASVQTTPSPPQYNIVVTRTGGVSCPYPTGVSQVVGTAVLNAPGSLGMVGGSLGLAVGYVKKNGFSGSSANIYSLVHVDTATLAVMRNADILCDYRTGNIITGSLSISADGTGVSVFGTKDGKINGQSGTYYSASFVNFFTSTTPPTYFVF